MRGGEHARTSPSPRRRAPRRPLLRARARTRAAGDLPARPRAGARRRLRPDPTAEGREGRDADRLDRRARTVPVEPRRGARVVALEPGQSMRRLGSEPEPARVAGSGRKPYFALYTSPAASSIETRSTSPSMI